MRLGPGLPELVQRYSRIAVLVAVPLTGCMVRAAEHEKVVNALVVEQSAHRKTEAEVAQLRERLAELTLAVEEKEQELHAQEFKIAQTQFDRQLVDKEREAASQLVDQLRGELARVADNLRLYSTQKHELEAELEAALDRAQKAVRAETRASMHAALIRDYALLLPATLASGSTQLKLVDGRPQLRVPADELKGENGNGLSPRAEAIIRASAKLLERYPEVRLQLTTEPTSKEGSVLVEQLIAALQQGGVAKPQILVAEASSEANDASPSASLPANVVWTLVVPD